MPAKRGSFGNPAPSDRHERASTTNRDSRKKLRNPSLGHLRQSSDNPPARKSLPTQRTLPAFLELIERRPYDPLPVGAGNAQPRFGRCLAQNQERQVVIPLRAQALQVFRLHLQNK